MAVTYAALEFTPVSITPASEAKSITAVSTVNEVDCTVQNKQLHCSSDEGPLNGAKSADANERDKTQSTEVEDYRSGSLLGKDASASVQY
jgi:hypothetical protein